MMEIIKKFLLEELGYEQFEVDLTIEDIERVDQDSFEIIMKYISGEDVSEYGYRDYTVKKLMTEKGFNAIASIIAVSNLKKDYEYYSNLFSKPIK